MHDSARESVADDPIPTEPFLLREGMREQPSHFEVVFLLNGVQYRYGFEATQERVVREWLFYTPSLREATLFNRNIAGLHIPSHSPFREGRGLSERVRPNALLLSVAAQFNGKIATRVQQWITRRCRTLTAANDSGYIGYTQKCIEDGKYHFLMNRLIADLDLDIVGLSLAEEKPPPEFGSLVAALKQGQNEKGEPRELSFGRPSSRIRTRHAIRDENGIVVREEDFPIEEMESEGTQKLIALCGPLFDVLTEGRILFLDEIDARLHPLITRAVVRLFHSEETNPNGAQLICATHDSNLLNDGIFRRDQVFFTAKDQSATNLYSLADFKIDGKRVRGGLSFEEPYIEGRYGAVPSLGDLRRLFIEEARGEAERAFTGSAEE